VVKERTSGANGNGEEGALFDETVAAYSNRRKAAEELLVSALAESHAKALRAYTHNVQWTTVGESAVLGKTGPPPNNNNNNTRVTFFVTRNATLL
jgi:hypothetical protein